jgi:hypothetical protein
VHGSNQLCIETICTQIKLDDLDCGKLTNENTANTDALKEMERLQTLEKFNENYKRLYFVTFKLN